MVVGGISKIVNGYSQNCMLIMRSGREQRYYRQESAAKPTIHKEIDMEENKNPLVALLVLLGWLYSFIGMLIGEYVAFTTMGFCAWLTFGWLVVAWYTIFWPFMIFG